MKAGLYARVSREEQAEGYSIDEQLYAMREFCKARRWEIAAEFIEPGVSGTTEDRPAFQRALKSARAGDYDILITHQLDRFFRNLQLQLQTLGELGQWNVSYVSVTEQIDYSTPQGMLFLSMLGAFNEYYVANLRRETEKGKRARAREGLSNSTYAPYGYRRVEGEDVFQVYEEEALVVHKAFELYASGTYSDQELAVELNRRGYPASGRAKSGRWTREGVRYVLDNPYYVGKVRHQDTVYDGLHEPIVEEELWKRVHRLRRKRGMKRGRGGGSRAQKNKYLLEKVAVCPHCKLPMHSTVSGKRGRGERYTSKYYRCPSRFRGFECPSESQVVPVEFVDSQMSALIKRLQLPANWRNRLDDKIAGQVKGSGRASSAASQIEDLQMKLARIREIYVDGDYTREEYDERKKKIEEQIAYLEEEADLYELEAEDLLRAGEALATLREEWDSTDLAYKNRMMRLIFEAVYVDTLLMAMIAVKPNPEFVELFRMDGLQEIDDGIFYVES